MVENDEISTEIIKLLNASKGGRVTFIPLNRVRAPRVTYPQNSDVVPLLKRLNFLSEYAAAFGQVSFHLNNLVKPLFGVGSLSDFLFHLSS